MSDMSETAAMKELTRLMWERYIKPRASAELLSHSLEGYKAQVTANNGDGTLTVARPFDGTAMTLKCPPALAVSAAAGDQVLVVELGDASNAFVLCGTDMSGFGDAGGFRPVSFDFSTVGSGYFTETVEDENGNGVTTVYDVTFDANGRIDSVTSRTDGWETDVDWGTYEPLRASEVSYDNASSGLTAANVQDAIDEVAQGGGGGGAAEDIIATVEPTATASRNYVKDDYLILSGVLYRATTAIAQGASITVGTNVTRAVLGDDVANHVGDTSNPHSVTAPQVGLGNVANERQYSADNPPPYPVTSVNGETGTVVLDAADMGAVPTTREVNGHALSSDITLTASDVGAAAPGDIPSAYTSNPEMDGTASPGSSTAWARGDHVHPSDTSRVPTSREVNGKALSADITLTASDVGARPDTWTPSAGDVGAQPTITASGILKGDGSGGVSAAVAGTDYQTPLAAGTDYATPAMIPAVPAISASAPAMDGTANAGSTGEVSDAGHVHPSDTTKANQAQLAYVESGTTATKNYLIGEYFCRGGELYRATAAISSGASFNSSNCESVRAMDYYSDTWTPVNVTVASSNIQRTCYVRSGGFLAIYFSAALNADFTSPSSLEICSDVASTFGVTNILTPFVKTTVISGPTSNISGDQFFTLQYNNNKLTLVNRSGSTIPAAGRNVSSWLMLGII